jgi:hypothetical protein
MVRMRELVAEGHERGADTGKGDAIVSGFSFRGAINPFAAALVAALGFSLALGAGAAGAAEPVFQPGDPIVTGFSGVVEPADVPSGTDPLDLTFIDPAGKSVVVQTLHPDGPAAGQLIDTPEAFGVTAADVGQVFGVALDDAPELTGAAAPNIYVAATSAFGLNLVVPGPDGNPIRSRTGAADASFMPGQWGGAGGETGYPGSIWKIDGVTGEVSLFSTIAANTGAGLGGIAYDSASAQFFVSDLDTGLIYRLALDGTILDSYDHGVTGRPAHGLSEMADDGSAVDITDGGFNTEDPTTWGFTQAERSVYAVATHNGRLYYSVGPSSDSEAPSIWSVGIKADGSFGVPRWELDATGLPSNNQITGIVFDPQGRMILAQRGAVTGAYDYLQLAEGGTSSVVRYKREFPDDPTTPSVWAADPDSYAIGLAEGGTSASGGIALGYGYNADDNAFSGACSATLWATGDALRNNPDLTPPVDGPVNVNGLQGMARSGVRPVNDPPLHAFFADRDGNTDDATASQVGHVGSVAIWQVCEGPSAPPADIEPPDFIPPPDYVPPEHYNLTLEKWAKPHFCFDGPAAYWCSYTIRVENTGTVPYWGPVNVHDYLPANPPGATMSFWPQPPWSCGPSGPSAADCSIGPVLLYPGDGVVLHEVVKLNKPVAPGVCQLVNVAGLQWPFFGGDDDPSDDFDGAVAALPIPGCVPPGAGVADLTLTKYAFPANCIDAGIDYLCRYGVLVQNAGPGNYTGPIQVKDTLGVNAPANTFGPWACGQVGPVLTCNIIAPPVNAPPGWSSGFFVQAHVKKPAGPPLCDLVNKANINLPAGGSPNNILPGNDFDQATTHILSPACLAPQPHTDLKITKSPLGCVFLGGNYWCKWQFNLTNIGPDPYVGALKLKDTSLGATFSTLPTVLPWCAGTSVVNCNLVGPVVLPPGVPHIVPFWTKYSPGPSVCSASNNIDIVFPNPGSVQNPSGNDSASANQPIPNPACGGAGPKLNITKTAKGCASDPSSTDWLCKFEIKVKNFGGSPQPLPLKVMDFNTKPTTFSGAACPLSSPNHWLCSKPAPLAAGATWTFTATTRVDPNGVTLADCNVDNTVWIDTPFSFDPGHFAQANQKVPQLFINPGPGPVFVYCDPPSLKLNKTAGKTVKSGDGYDTSFTITATSTGPDPYHGTIELDEVLPDGTSYVSSSWPCSPTTGNDMHCSSPYVDLPVGQSKSMTIVIHTPKAAAIENKCAITNTVNVAISAQVLHSDKGAQYTASATAKLPADACAKPPVCAPNQVKPGGGCCDPGLVWNGRTCAPPKPIPPTPPKCPRDSTLGDNGQCLCKDGTHGKPGKCVPDEVVPICPKDSVLSDGECSCKDGTHGRPGKCVPDEVVPICPKDSVLNDGECQCKDGTHGRPGRCVPDEIVPICPRDSVLNDGECMCKPGTHGTPGRCVPDQEVPICRKDSVLVDGECVCKPGTHGTPGRCVPDVQIEIPVKPILPVIPITPQCPDDSHYDKRAQSCVCNKPLVGKPGECQAQLQILRLPDQPVIK